MEIFICSNVFVPLRSGPSHRSEMLSQILFGEKYVVIGNAGKWQKITTIFDNYTGWIDGDHIQPAILGGEERGVVINKAMPCFRPDGTKLMLEPGCEVYNPDQGSGIFSLGKQKYTTPAGFTDNCYNSGASKADTAMQFLNSPYIWGGRIPSGIDCSGLTQLVYKIHGIAIPRDSSQQSEAGQVLSFLEEAAPGDLLFFDNELGKITHVGIFLSEGLVIHASGRVRIDRIDHQGIYNNDLKKYTHKLRTIVRIA
jgi:gamma-D-glutamyl-L-lysine dipeptidyl-peptidase